MTRDAAHAHNPITVEVFAKRVATAVCRFIDVSTFSMVWGGLITDIRTGCIANHNANTGTRGEVADWPRCHHQG